MDTISFTPQPADGNASTRLSGSRLSLNASGSKSNWATSSLRRKSRIPAAGHGPKKALVTIDKDHTVRVVNQRACELFGYTAAELKGMALSTLVPSLTHTPEKVCVGVPFVA